MTDARWLSYLQLYVQIDKFGKGPCRVYTKSEAFVCRDIASRQAFTLMCLRIGDRWAFFFRWDQVEPGDTMSNRPTAYICESLENCDKQVDVIAYGEPDDHLRLTVLLGELVAGSEPQDATRDWLEVCKAPSSSWEERREALIKLFELRGDSLATERSICIGDVDGLYQGKLDLEDHWKDASFRRERQHFFDLLLELAGETKGLDFARTVRNPAVSAELDEHNIFVQWSQGTPKDPAVVQLVGRLAPEVQPIAQWLLDEEVLDERSFERYRQASKDLGGGDRDFEEHLIDIAFDSIPGPVRDIATKLAQLRGPQLVNGSVGPFLMASQGSAVDEDGLQEPAWNHDLLGDLLASRLLRQSEDNSTVRMPRMVRERLLERQPSSERDTTRNIHQQFAEFLKRDSNTTASIESHYHAIQSGDAELAVETATFYRSDLRSLAYELSYEQREFLGAADLYQRIVDVDDEDAYAWEYLAYNLAVGSGSELSEEQAERIEKAYERAADLEPNNPLYWGRHYGFLAERGKLEDEQFSREFQRFEKSFAEKGMSFFASRVFEGWERAGNDEKLKDVVGRWHRWLADCHDERIEEFLERYR